MLELWVIFCTSLIVDKGIEACYEKAIIQDYLIFFQFFVYIIGYKFIKVFSFNFSS